MRELIILEHPVAVCSAASIFSKSNDERKFLVDLSRCCYVFRQCVRQASHDAVCVDEKGRRPLGSQLCDTVGRYHIQLCNVASPIGSRTAIAWLLFAKVGQLVPVKSVCMFWGQKVRLWECCCGVSFNIRCCEASTSKPCLPRIIFAQNLHVTRQKCACYILIIGSFTFPQIHTVGPRRCGCQGLLVFGSGTGGGGL